MATVLLKLTVALNTIFKGSHQRNLDVIPYLGLRNMKGLQ